jgi:hypothetical protein
MVDFKFKGHLVYTNESEGLIAISRIKVLGGAVETIKIYNVDEEVGYFKMLNKINNIVKLDDEMFHMISESQR